MRIIVDNVELDFFTGKNKIAINLKSADIGDLKTREVNYSNQFSIPKTPNNISIFGSADNEKVISNSPYVKKSALIIESGVIIQEGFIILDSTTDDSFNVHVVSGAAKFFDLIKGKTLQDLNFVNSVNIAWDSSSIESRRASVSDVVSPVLDYGNFKITGSVGDIDINSYLPSVYYHTIIKHIVEQAGYTFDTNNDVMNFLSNNFYKLIVPFSRSAWKYNQKFVSDRTAIAYHNTSQSWLAVVNRYIDFNTESIDISGWFNSSAYKPVESGVGSITMFNFDVELVIDLTMTSSYTINIELYNVTSGVVISNFAAGVGSTGSYSNSLKLTNVVGVNNREYKVRISYASGGGGSVPSITINTAKVSFIPSDVPNTNYLFINQLLPDMSQQDFMKDLALRFCVLFKEDNKTLYFKSMQSIISKSYTAKDWSLKRVNTNSNSIKFSYLSYAQKNNFTFESGDELYDYQSHLGNSYFSIGNENITEESDFYNSPFCYTGHRKTAEYDIAHIPIYETSTVRTTFDNSCGLRLLLVRDKYSFERSVKYSSNQSSYKVAYFNDPAQSYTMFWSKFINDWYLLLVLALQEMKVVEHEYLLNAEDIKSFDFFHLIFDNYSSYIVSEIINYTEGQITKVKLLKIN